MVNSANEGSSIVVTSIQRFKGLIHLVELYFKNMMKGNTVWNWGDNQSLWASNAAPLLCKFQNKVKFLLKVVLISGKRLFSGQPPLY